jgi:ribosome-associated protein
MLKITGNISLGAGELVEQFIRAPGPGGQNVNKVATAVRLRFNVRESPSLPSDLRDRLLMLAENRINETGEIVIVARRFRTQARNRSDARTRLIALIRTAMHTPKPRGKTVPSTAIKRRRRIKKQHRSEVKRARNARINSD